MPKIWPKQSDLEALHALFGKPDANNDGAPDPTWTRDHLTTIVPPYQLYFNGAKVKVITCNKAIAAPLLAALGDVQKHYGTAEAIARSGMDRFDGCYNFRVKRGNASSLSMHAYAIALDFNARDNRFRSKGGTMPAEVVAIFKANGAVWGGDWSPKSRDPMHFQWATV